MSNPPSRTTAPPGAVLITGAARRIGRAIACDLAATGRPIAIHYHSSGEDAGEAVAEIEKAGGRAVALAADLGDEGAVRELVPRAVDAIGSLDCLINNASVFENDTIDSVTADSWHAHMQVNLRAPFVLIQEFARRLPVDATGNIVNLIDERVWNLTPYFVSYTVSKAGLWALTRTMALALAPRIRVNGIGPGPTLQSARQTAEQFRRQWERLPLQRPIELDEICRAVRFILDAPAMTGQMIALDGGQHLGWTQPLSAAPHE